MSTASATKLQPSAFGFSVTQLQPALGAEIGDIDLSRPLDDATRDALQALLFQYKVLFFRDQDLTQAQQIALGRRFGDLEIHPLRSLDDQPEILRIDSSEARARGSVYERLNAHWHSDTSFRDAPAAASILRGVEVPDIGGDTVWADAVAAYEGLLDDVKQRIATLTAEHSAVHGFGRYEYNRDKLEEVARKHPPIAHPVVRTHPVTGAKILFVNSVFTSHIVGLPKAESDELLNYLWNEFKRPEYQVRLKWKRNTIAFWDNRATQHYGVYNHGDVRRVVERVTIIGEKPF